jgi:tetratricopeptide (TPR) repeat protein
MRTAILLAPRPSESEAAREERSTDGSWLESVLEPWGFRVLHASGEDALGELQGALGVVNRDEELLVHVSGELESPTTLILDSGAEGNSVSLAKLDRIVRESGARSFILAELRFSPAAGDAMGLGAEITDADLTEMKGAFAPYGSGGSGSAVLIAVHGATRSAKSLPFTRLVVRATAELLGDGRPLALLSEVIERLGEMPESHAIAERYTFVPGTRDGAHDFELALPADALLDAPDFALLAELVDHAFARGDWPHAAAGYRALLPLCVDEKARSAVYGRLASAEEGQGHTGHARRAYAKAIKDNPLDLALHDALIRLETEKGQWARVIAAMRERLELIASPSERVEELFSLARITLEMQRDIQGAVKYLETARAIDGSHEDVLEALRRSYRVLGQWSSLIDVTGALAERAPTATERAARHLAQAQIARKHLGDADQGATFLLAALEADPTHDEALDVLCELRVSRYEEDLLAQELASVVDRLSELGDEDRVKDVLSRLGNLKTAPSRRSEVPTQEIFPVRLEELDDESGSVMTALENEIERAPLVTQSHAALFAMHVRAGRAQRAYLSALALEELGAVDDAALHILARCRPTGLSVRSPLDLEAWRLLRAPGSDDVLEALVGSVGRAAGVARFEDRKAKKRLLVLDEDRRQPDTSTASIVRTFHWAADVLGVTCPDLYVLDEVPGDVVAVPGAPPKTAIGPGVLTGLSTIDLAFLCARHLTYYRPEYLALIGYPTLNELSLLTLAALQIALPAMPIPANVEGAVTALRTGLKRHLLPDERDALRLAVAKLDARGGRFNLQAWIRSAEFTAARVGLLLCGDLRAGMSRIRSETRTVAELSVESKRLDLLSFSAVGNLAVLRERLAGPTMHPSMGDSGLVTRSDRSSAKPGSTASSERATG